MTDKKAPAHIANLITNGIPLPGGTGRQTGNSIYEPLAWLSTGDSFVLPKKLAVVQTGCYAFRKRRGLKISLRFREETVDGVTSTRIWRAK